jgi:hypothetical protein
MIRITRISKSEYKEIFYELLLVATKVVAVSECSASL